MINLNINLKINLKLFLIAVVLFSTFLSSCSDRQYNSADETRVVKYNLDSKQTVEINNPQIRQIAG